MLSYGYGTVHRRIFSRVWFFAWLPPVRLGQLPKADRMALNVCVCFMQALQNIRTVVAYVGEAQTCKQYNAALAKPQKVSPRMLSHQGQIPIQKQQRSAPEVLPFPWPLR